MTYTPEEFTEYWLVHDNDIVLEAVEFDHLGTLGQARPLDMALVKERVEQLRGEARDALVQEIQLLLATMNKDMPGEVAALLEVHMLLLSLHTHPPLCVHHAPCSAAHRQRLGRPAGPSGAVRLG